MNRIEWEEQDEDEDGCTSTFWYSATLRMLPAMLP